MTTTLQRQPKHHKNITILKIDSRRRPAFFHALAVIILSLMCLRASAAESIHLIVAYNDRLDFSEAVFKTVEQQNGSRPLPFQLGSVKYRANDFTDLSNLLATIQGPILVLGPAGSDDAASIDSFFRSRPA